MEPMEDEKPRVGIGDAVRQERLRRAWSQSQLADKLGLALVTVNLIELGKTKLSLRSRAAIARVFGWPTDWPELLLDQDVRVADLPELAEEEAQAMIDYQTEKDWEAFRRAEGEGSSDSHWDSEELILAANIGKLTPKQREAVASIIEQLLEEK